MKARILPSVQAENLFNTFCVTEPGYPMKGRMIALGMKFTIGHG